MPLPQGFVAYILRSRVAGPLLILFTGFDKNRISLTILIQMTRAFVTAITCWDPSENLVSLSRTVIGSHSDGHFAARISRKAALSEHINIRDRRMISRGATCVETGIPGSR